MSKLPELVAAAKCVIENVDTDALLSYFGLKTDLRQGAPAIKVSVLHFYLPVSVSPLNFAINMIMAQLSNMLICYSFKT